MERSDRVAQLYGYSVCLIAVVVALFSVSQLVDNVFKYSDPIRAESLYSGASLRSFEAYKATYEDQNGVSPDLLRVTQPKAQTPKPSDAQLRTRYEALRADRIASVHFEAARSIVGSTLLLLISIGLFLTHWRWLSARRATVNQT